MPVHTQDLEKELLDLERRGWESIAAKDPAHYRGIVVPETVIVDDEGVHRGVDLAEQIDKVPVRMEVTQLGDSRLIRLDPDNAVLTYRVTVDIEGAGSRAIYASSVYARRDGGWRLVFHQQTPITD